MGFVEVFLVSLAIFSGMAAGLLLIGLVVAGLAAVFRVLGK